MFMKLVKEDITTVKYGIIPHGVNCQGAMASGVAKAIKEKWPKIYDSFLKNGTGPEMLGKVHFIDISRDIWVVNCYTQEYYGRDGKKYASLDAVRSAMVSVFSFAAQVEMPVCMPKIGCGLGGLDWETEVKPIIQELATRHDIMVYIYEI